MLPGAAQLNDDRLQATGAGARLLEGSRQLARLARRAGEWWLGEMATLLPPRLRQLAQRRSHVLLIDLSTAHIVHLQDGASQAARPFSAPDEMCEVIRDFTAAHLPKRHTAMMRMPAPRVLCKRIELPAEAEQNLRDILAFEIDRRTPFKAEDVFFDAHVRDRTDGGRTLLVDWVIAPREAVSEVLRLAAQWRISPSIIDAPRGEPGRPGTINLLPAAALRETARSSRRLSILFGALAGFLAALAMYVPIARQEAALAELTGRIDDAKRKAGEAQGLRAELDRLVQEGRFAADRKRRSLSVVMVLDDLTRLLPDDTWISDLQIVGKEVHVAGFTQSASALVALIEGSRAFHSVRFRSPVTPAASGDRERFQVSFEPRTEVGR